MKRLSRELTARVPRRLRLLLLALLCTITLAILSWPARQRAVMSAHWYRQLAELNRQRNLESVTPEGLVGLLRSLTEKPKDLPALLHAASIAAQLRQYDDAIFLLQEACELAPQDPRPHAALAEAYEAARYPDRAFQEWARAAALNPKDLEVQLRLAYLYMSVGWSNAALQHLDQARRIAPNEPRVHVASALRCVQIADFTTALKHLHEAERLQPKSDKVYSLMADAYSKSTQLQQAERAARRAVELNPYEAQYRVQLAEALLAFERPKAAQEAEKILRELVKHAPDDATAWYNLGLCALRARRDREAIACFENVLVMKSHKAPAAMYLGRLYLKHGKVQAGRELMQAYQRVLRRANDIKSLNLHVFVGKPDASSYRQLAKLLTNEQDARRAVITLRRGLKHYPHHPGLRDELYRLLIASGRWDLTDEGM